MLDLEKARKELSEKTLSEIQKATAWTWASRAVVSFENVLLADKEKKVSVFMAGQEYLHEAIEHASLVDDSSDFVDQIRMAVMESVAEAVADVDMSLDIDL